MARPEPPQFDDVLTAVSQAWIGGMKAWGDVYQRMWGQVQEGAHVEAQVVGDNQADVYVTGPGGAITISPLEALNGGSIIGPESIQLSRAGIPDNVLTKITVTVFPSPGNATLTHTGRLRDVNGRNLARVVVPVTPPSA